MKKIVTIGILVVLGLAFAYQKYGYLIQSYRNNPRSEKLENNEPLSLTPPETNRGDPALSYLKVPPGFALSYYADTVPGARSLAVGNNAIVYVGTRGEGVVYALEDSNNDGRADTRYIVASGLNNPNGVAYQDGALYVTEIGRVIKFSDIDSTYKNKPTYQVIYDDLPDATHHGWRYTRFGPDGRLYIGIGAPCNICTITDPYASIASINADGSDFQIVARGIRNTVGFDWNPGDGSLWFTDNGRDSMGDNIPDDELNRVGLISHFGFPFCHADSIQDPQFGGETNCDEYSKPKQLLGPHVAALGMWFYRGDMFSREYSNAIFQAQHGSWNRSTPIGYRVMVAAVDGESIVSYREFITGFLDAQGNALGRPVDIIELPDGSLLISDDKKGAVYRVTSSPL